MCGAESLLNVGRRGDLHRLSRPTAPLSNVVKQPVAKVALTAEVDICSGKNEHKSSTGVDPQRGKKEGGRGKGGGGPKQRSTFKLNQAEGMS